MATETPKTSLKAQFEALSKDANLEILLPRSPGFDVCSALKKGSLQGLERLPSRRNLFFDERAIITVILRTEQNEDAVRAILPKLEIALAAHATEAVPQGSGNAASASGKHDLTSKTIPASESIGVVSNDNGTFVIWSPVLELYRPRARLQRPAVYFTVHLSISAAALLSDRADGKVYLKSLEPSPANVLEPLQFTPFLVNTNVFLSETRVTKVAPTTGRALDDAKPLRNVSKRAFPIVAALFTKIRYSALPDSVMASLHLETSQVVTGNVCIKTLHLNTLDARLETLNPPDLPLPSFPGDETVILYRLKPKHGSSSPSTLSVQIEAAVIQDGNPQVDLAIQWQTQVDVSQTAAKATYKWSRPMSSSSIRPPARPSFHSDSRAGSVDLSDKTPAQETGVTFNIWTPAITPPLINFKLHVQCVNRSDRPRRFAIVVVEPKKRSLKIDANVNSENLKHLTSIHDAPLQTQRPPDVFDLNPDVRIGPLPPGAVYETELRFWATTRGVLDLGIVRIVDLDTRQIVDVRELPDVVVLDPNA